MRATAVLLAGSRPGGDPLAKRFGLETKALIPLNGKPMIDRPLRALSGSAAIGEVRVMAQNPAPLIDALGTIPNVRFERSHGTIATTLLGLIERDRIEWPMIVTTADHALLDSTMVGEFAAAALGADLAIAVVEKGPLLARLPGTRRTWLKFRNGAYTGANLFALGGPRAVKAVELWKSVEQDRKKGWRVIAALGPLVLLGATLKLLTVDQVADRLGRKLGLKIRVVRMSDPLAGVDVDKLEDHALVEAILDGRA